ncbi:HPr kinase/phosphorylase [Brevundimonas sp. GCM10030266]|uniref:HPr kinase/phosphorylase n=1 Tax=Brevundimonas sp. GCM10030266 TaxID=3273386 RepID=UPI0036170C13
MTNPIHVTVVARCGSGGRWRGVAIFGPSGAGKSDLALRLIARDWRLVADDYAWLFASGGRLFARAPDTIRGRIEARGVGILKVSSVDLTPVALAVELTTDGVERLPEPEKREVSGVSLPLLRLDPREVSAGEKVAAALARL